MYMSWLVVGNLWNLRKNQATTHVPFSGNHNEVKAKAKVARRKGDYVQLGAAKMLAFFE